MNPAATVILPSGDISGAADTLAISTALAALPGATVQLAPGVFWVNGPLVLSSGQRLTGAGGNVLATAAYRTTIKAAPGWVQGAAPAAAMVCPGGAAGCSEVAVADLNIDGAGVAANGIMPAAAASNVLIRDVRIQDCAGAGLASGPVPSNTWRGVRVMSRGNGALGFGASFADSSFTDCEALGNGTHGWYTYNPVNTRFTGCRSEWNAQQGYWIQGDGAATGGCTLTGCSTDRNGAHGLLCDAGGNWPVLVSGFMARRDGRNSAAGSFAGLAVTATCTAPVIIDGITVFPGFDDAGTGIQSPQYGANIAAAPAWLAISSALFHGVSSGILGQANITSLRGVASRSGTWSSPGPVTPVPDTA